MSDEKEKGHWFISSVKNWACDVNLRKALNRLHRADGQPEMDVIIWWVPGPADAEYELDNYAPVVQGRKYISHVNLEHGGPL